MLQNSEKPQQAFKTKDIYAQEALKYAPKLLTLLDRNKFRPTYGCFDREFWHYKTIDFPCGMSQELVTALALLYKYKFVNNIFYNNKRIFELVIASIEYTMRSTHKDGSCDEYYPFERALGATTFSLYACTESYILLGIKNKEFEDFFRRRADWFLKNPEVGILANHEALSALALLNVYIITGNDRYKLGSQARLDKALSHQSPEGWFKEYEGCDPGYNTWTIDFLAKYFKKTGDRNLLKPLKMAVEFASYFIHPDGSYGGEYGSRDSYNFFPHGFEILGKIFPLATQICDGYLEGILNNKRSYLDENRIFGHHMTNYLMAYLDFNEDRKGRLLWDNFKRYFKDAGLYVAKKGDYHVVISLKKGGVLKLFKNDKNIYSDTGFIGRLNDGSIVVSHLMSKKEIFFEGGIIVVRGHFDEMKYHQPNVLKFLIFRLFLFLFGVVPGFSKGVRKFLQKMLIVNKKKVPVEYKREFILTDGGLSVTDTIILKSSKRFKKLAIGSDHTSIYTAVSNCYQESILNSWVDLDAWLGELENKKEITVKRVIE